LRGSSRLDHDHRLGACRGAGRRHELASVLDCLDIEHDRACRAIQSKEIQEIAEIDIDLVANREDGGESNRAARRPFDHSCNDRAGLRDDGEVAMLRHAGGKARIQSRRGHQHAEAIRADESQARGPCRAFSSLRERAGSVTKPRCDDDGGRHALAGNLQYRFGYGRGRHRDNRYVGHLQERRQGLDGRNTLNIAVVGIDHVKLPGKATGNYIGDDVPAHRVHMRARPNHGERAGREDAIEAIGRHRNFCVLVTSRINLPLRRDDVRSREALTQLKLPNCSRHFD
jgi:hypothetical protein